MSDPGPDPLAAGPEPRVVVVGAGVIGLTTAVVLLERGVRVRIVARERSPRTTSDVPGALWYPFKAEPLARVLAWARVSHARFTAFSEADTRSGVRVREGLEVYPWKVAAPWWSAAVPSPLRRAWPGELPPGFVDGFVFQAPVIETPLYMPWLEARACALGATIEVSTVTELADLGAPGAVIVNCSGLGARELARDPSVYASRGQLVHLPPLPLQRFTLDEAVRGSISYVIPREDAVVIGGTVEDHVESLEPSPEATEAILARARRIEPRIAGLPVTRVTVGLRPCRSVVRIEAEPRAGGFTIVHNYGHGGAGFTLSWGAAEEAAGLVERALEELRRSG